MDRVGFSSWRLLDGVFSFFFSRFFLGGFLALPELVTASIWLATRHSFSYFLIWLQPGGCEFGCWWISRTSDEFLSFFFSFRLGLPTQLLLFLFFFISIFPLFFSSCLFLGEGGGGRPMKSLSVKIEKRKEKGSSNSSNNNQKKNKKKTK